jgi:hypothetical protein
MSEANPQWKNWGDHPFVVVIGLAAAIIAIVAFVRDKTNSSPPPTPPASSIVGIWDQYVKDEDGRLIYIGKFVVTKQNERYSMGAKEWADPATIVRSVSLYDVTYDGEWWTFKSDWENGGTALFRLHRVSDTIFEGESTVNGQRRRINKWVKVE